jgi:hypothetical protein
MYFLHLQGRSYKCIHILWLLVHKRTVPTELLPSAGEFFLLQISAEMYCASDSLIELLIKVQIFMTDELKNGTHTLKNFTGLVTWEK